MKINPISIKNINYKKILITFFYLILLSILFLWDDYIFRLFKPIPELYGYKGRDIRQIIILLIGITTFIAFTKKKLPIYILLGFFALISLIQLNYLAYFGDTIHPSILPKLITEMNEITKSGFGEFNRVYFAFLSTIIPYSIIFVLIKKYNDYFYKLKYSFVFILVLLIPIVRTITNETINKRLGRVELPTFYNGLNISSIYFFKLVPLQFTANTDYKDYIITKTKPLHDDVNIILNMGESFNYYNQHLFGYEIPTTPFLDSIKDDKNFVYKKGLGNAFNTITALVTFFNLQRESENFNVNVKQETNLFKLAKEQGFRTILISAQERYNMRFVGTQYIDVFIAKEDMEDFFNEEHDEGLLQILKERGYLNEGKNFIVLHQRNAHSPYKDQWENKIEKFEKFKKIYDNNIYINDTIYKDTIAYLKTTKHPFYYFITSDHGEMTGQDGLYGHFEGQIRCIEIPMYLYTNDQDRTILNEFKNNFLPVNYEMGLLLAKIMGYTIENPNTPYNEFNVSADWDKKSFYYKIIKDYESKTHKLEYVGK